MKSTRSAEHISYFKTIRELKFHGKSSVVTHLLQRCTYNMLIAQYEEQGASFLRAEPKKKPGNAQIYLPLFCNSVSRLLLKERQVLGLWMPTLYTSLWSDLGGHLGRANRGSDQGVCWPTLPTANSLYAQPGKCSLFTKFWPDVREASGYGGEYHPTKCLLFWYLLFQSIDWRFFNQNS